jgi:DNA polymerase I - 3''-5'' exonuclease and polymerase domains
MRDPSLQNLSRKFRGLLKNEHLPYGYRYVYVDFGQFEAGILAGLSGNKRLEKIYEDDVLYEKLAGMSKMSDRDTAKVAFYCYVYGGIISKGSESFFELYGLKDVIDNVIKNAKEKGYVESPLGNRRIIKSVDDTKWIMNHYIQGTSSLIFKQALIDVFSSFQTKAVLLIPMHDAALYLVDTSISTESLINTFKSAFTKWIPKSKPVVKEKNFFEE